jgi:hypothetical protein
MASYESVIGILEAELTAVADAFGALTPARRPAALSGDLEWVLAASGRAPAEDGRLPLIG